MRPKSILQRLCRSPFEPFRIHLSDGSAHDITHPELAIVERSKVIVGVRGPQGVDGPVERTVFCTLAHITRTEAVSADVREPPHEESPNSPNQ